LVRSNLFVAVHEVAHSYKEKF